MTPHDSLRIHARPALEAPQLVMGFSGWMDGGDVSTGVVDHLVELLDARELAEIAPHDFHVYNVPGSMDVSAVCRPHTRIEDGVIRDFTLPQHTFTFSQEHNLILFRGKEPNLHWEEYADCFFRLVDTFGVRAVYFIGSVAGTVPHTREPRMYCSVSDEGLKPPLEKLAIRPTNYEGPASIVTLLTRLAGGRGLPMVTVVTEVPAYIQGRNPRCIEAVIHKMALVLGIPFDLDALRKKSDAFELRLSDMVEERSELSTFIRKLEHDYDNEIISTESDDLKAWMERQGLRPD